MSEVVLATGGYDEKIVFWNPGNELATRVLPIKDSHINALAVSPNRRYLIAAAYKSVKLFNLEN